MAHPDSNPVVLSISPDASEKEWDDFNMSMDELFDAQEAYDKQIADELGISIHDAMLVGYLRNRSRWTQEKEDHLVSLARAGKPLPNVLGGEF